MNIFIYIRAVLIVALLAFTSPLVAGGHTGGGPTVTVGMEKQLEMRDWFDGFAGETDYKFFQQVGEMNGALEFEDRFEETEYSEFHLRVTRGEVMEKAGRMMAPGKKLSPGRGDRELTWGRFYALDMHPKTPLVGMLHATIVMQMFADNTVQTGGWLGVMPGTRIEEDLALLKKVTDDYFASRGKDPSLYRQLICKGTHETIAEFRRKPACSGVSFYGPPVYPKDPEASIKFIAGLFDEFVTAYMDIVRERADDKYTAADVAAQDEMRRQWLIDQLFSDPFASAVVPFHIWSFANMPPVVKF